MTIVRWHGADTEIGPQHRTRQVNNTCQQFRIKINVSKTVTVVISKNQNVTVPLEINREILKIVNWKGRGLYDSSNCSVTQNWILGSQNNKMSIFLYGAEIWALKVDLMTNLQTFKPGCYRRKLRIPWMARISNEEVWKRMGCERQLLFSLRWEKLDIWAISWDIKNVNYHNSYLWVK